MIAIAKIGGHQALVTNGETIEVDKLSAKVGETVSFETLLLSESDGENCQIGAPVLENVTVKAKVLEHGRGEKITVFKMKPRKRYRRKQGHRQDYTLIEIVDLGVAAGKPAAKKTAEKTEKAADSKKPAVKKTAKVSTPKKPAVKKVAKGE